MILFREFSNQSFVLCCESLRFTIVTAARNYPSELTSIFRERYEPRFVFDCAKGMGFSSSSVRHGEAAPSSGGTNERVVFIDLMLLWNRSNRSCWIKRYIIYEFGYVTGQKREKKECINEKYVMRVTLVPPRFGRLHRHW